MSSMRSSSMERMQRLQMADLGTARREHVSTVDDAKNISHARLADIEATRKSNIPGTDAARLAKKDEARLSAWSNLHKTIGDTSALEDLSDILAGQSHRTQLTATLRATAGQKTKYGVGKDKTGAKGHHPIPAVSSGRGGGVIGTRGRAPNSPPRTSQPVRHPASKSPARSASHRLDPALDVNNDSPPQRGRGAHRGHGKRDQHVRQDFPKKQPRGSAIRGKRPEPVEDYSKKIASPEDFLAQVMGNRSVSSNPSVPPSTPPSRAVSTAVDQPSRRPQPIFRRIRVPVSPATTPVPVGTPAVKGSVPSILDTPTPPPRPAPLKTTGPIPLSQPLSANVKPQVSSKPDTSAPIGARKTELGPTKPSTPAVVIEKSRLESEKASRVDVEDTQHNVAAGEQATGDMLLDVDASPDTGDTKLKNAFMSPGCAELSGLDFLSVKEEEPSPVQVDPLHARRDSGPAEDTKSQSTLMPRKLADTTMLAQKLIERMSGFKKTVESSVTSTLEQVSGRAASSVPEQETTPRPPSFGNSLVQDWLRDTPADQLTPSALQVAGSGSFSRYRSPANSPSSVESAPQKSAGTYAPTLSPHKSMASECMSGFETLRVRESPTRDTARKDISLPATTISTAGGKAAASGGETKPKVNPLALSIHAAPWQLHHEFGKAKVIGVKPFVDKDNAARATTKFEFPVRPSTNPPSIVAEAKSSASHRAAASTVETQKPATSRAPSTQVISPAPFVPSNQATRSAAENQMPVAGASSTVKVLGVQPTVARSREPQAAIETQTQNPVTSRAPSAQVLDGRAPFVPISQSAQALTEPHKSITMRPSSTNVLGPQPFVSSRQVTRSVTAAPQPAANIAPPAKVIGTLPFSISSHKATQTVPEAQKPAASVFSIWTQSSSNVPREAPAQTGARNIGPVPPSLSSFRPYVTSLSHEREQPRPPFLASYQTGAQAPPRAENQAASKVKTLGPPPFVKKTNANEPLKTSDPMDLL